MIKGTDDTRYAFVNGIIRAREARLLTRGHFDRLIAGELSSFRTIISDSPYVAYDDFAAGLLNEEKQIRDFVIQYCMTPQIIHVLDWPEQMHNVKVKIKGGNEDLLYTTVDNEVENWPETQTALERYTLNKDPFIFSTELDRILWERMINEAAFCPFFTGYYEMIADLENIRSFFRARQFENSRDIFARVFLPYGKLGYDLFISNIRMELEHLSKVFFITPYLHLIDRGAVYLQQHHSFLRLERLIEEVRMQYLIQARRMAFGVEPLYAFYHFKKSEIRKLQQVYWGKLNEVAIEDLKESISDVW
jgi:V/A-type H+-transporting ATPase subunit C